MTPSPTDTGRDRVDTSAERVAEVCARLDRHTWHGDQIADFIEALAAERDALRAELRSLHDAADENRLR